MSLAYDTVVRQLLIDDRVQIYSVCFDVGTDDFYFLHRPKVLRRTTSSLLQSFWHIHYNRALHFALRFSL